MVSSRHLSRSYVGRIGISCSHLALQLLLYGQHKIFGVEVHVLFHVLQSVNATSKILRHLAALNALNASGFQRLGKPDGEIKHVQKTGLATFEYSTPLHSTRLSRGAHLLSSALLSSFALWSKPRVQAKIEAIGLVEVALPFWCCLRIHKKQLSQL